MRTSRSGRVHASDERPSTVRLDTTARPPMNAVAPPPRRVITKSLPQAWTTSSTIFRYTSPEPAPSGTVTWISVSVQETGSTQVPPGVLDPNGKQTCPGTLPKLLPVMTTSVPGQASLG